MRIKALLGLVATVAALAAVQLDAAALTSGASLPTGNGSSVVATGALDTPPPPVSVVDAESACIDGWLNNLIPPIPPSPATDAVVGPPLICMEAGLALASGPSVTVSATWMGVTSSLNGGGLIATLSCQVAASVGFPTSDEPLTTTVNDCYLKGADGLQYLSHSLTLPGAAAAVASEPTSVPVQPYQVCVVGSASYLGGSAPSATACM